MAYNSICIHDGHGIYCEFDRLPVNAIMRSEAIVNNISILEKYMPAQAAELIAQWIAETSCQFKITGSRKSKFGDYRPPFGGKGHRISVNHDLNPYAFLITTVHEFAHLHTWHEHKNKVQPHGPNW